MQGELKKCIKSKEKGPLHVYKMWYTKKHQPQR